MRVLGIDPGTEGGVAMLGGESPQAFPLPYAGGRVCLVTLSGLVADWRPEEVWIEVPQSRPKEASSGAQSRGVAYGMMLGYFWLKGIPVHEVSPAKWKAKLGVGKDKSESVAMASRLFPSVELLPAGKRKPHDGMAEALLIAHYGRSAK